MDNPAFTKQLTRQSVLGEFKIAGSRDPDVLQAVRERLLENSRTTRRFGTVFMAIGIILIVLPAALGAPLWAVAVPFLPLVLFGWMQRSRGDGNIRLVDSVLAELASGS